MSLHYSGLIICSLCVGKGCQWRQEVVPKVAQLKQRLRLLPWHPDTGDPTASSAHGGHPIQDRAKSPNIGMLDRGYLFIYFSFIPELSQEKLHSHGREGDQLLLAAGEGGGLSSRASSTVIAVRCRQIGMSARQAQADWGASRMSVGPWDTGDGGGKGICHSRSLFCGQSPSFSTDRPYCDHFPEGEQTLRM